MSSPTPSHVATELIDAFAVNDLEGMRALMADDLRAYVTNAEGGVDPRTADEYVDGVRSMDVPTANLRLDVTQVTEPRPDQVMIMVEVHAERNGRKLHNFAAHLITVADGRASEWWMVEALPAESDAFWSA